MLYFPTGEEAGIIDKFTIETIGIPQAVLMERAALGLFDVVTGIIGDDKKKRTLVVVESGNNGGDGVALARLLTVAGCQADIMCLNGLKKRSDAFMTQLKIADNCGVKIHAGKLDIDSYDIIVDGIFGVGLSRPVEGTHREAIEVLNKAEALKIAIDIPSGISSVDGSVMGAAFKADITVTFGFTKLGMLFEPGREYSGKIIVKDIGFPDVTAMGNAPKAYSFEKNDIKRLLPKRAPSSHKGTYGKCLIIAGSRDISGAAYLSAAAAYGMGAGLVRILTEISNRRILAELLPEALLGCYDEDEPEKTNVREAIKWADSIVIGPGLGQGQAAKLLLENVLLYAECPVIIDADAINMMAADREHFDMLLSGGQEGRSIIITPHVLEMARFTGVAVPDIKKTALSLAKETARRHGITVVLKDARTVVASPDEESVYVNVTGNSSMSKGGSGDVLTGIIAALIAAGATPMDAARVGVYLHGAAGDKAREELGEYSVMARDIITFLSKII